MFYKWAFLFIFFFSFATYFIHHLILSIWFKTQNLAKRYPSAQWALVTGSSSGKRRNELCVCGQTPPQISLIFEIHCRHR